jgi:hypothetical protein
LQYLLLFLTGELFVLTGELFVLPADATQSETTI